MTGASREIEEEEDEKEEGLVRRPRETRVYEQASSSSLKVPNAITKESSRISAPAQAKPGVQSSAALAKRRPDLGKIEGSAATKPDSFSSEMSAQKGSDADAIGQKRRGPPQSSGDSSGVEGLLQRGNGTGTDQEGEKARQSGEAEEEKGGNNVQMTGTSTDILVDEDWGEEGLVRRPRERVNEQAGSSSVEVRDVAIGKESSVVTQAKVRLSSSAGPAEEGPARVEIEGSNPDPLTLGVSARNDSNSEPLEPSTRGPTDIGASPSGGGKESGITENGSAGGGVEDKVAGDDDSAETGAPPKTPFQKLVSLVLGRVNHQKTAQQQTDTPSTEQTVDIPEEPKPTDLNEGAKGEGGDGASSDQEDEPPASWEAYSFLLEAEDLLKEEMKNLKLDRERIVVAMQELIVQFGAVWTERVSLLFVADQP